jgi:ABC-type uncharacterized transport system ATPase component
MNLIRLALRSIAGNSFRSFVVLLCALLISSLALTTGMILFGAEQLVRYGTHSIKMADGRI